MVTILKKIAYFILQYIGTACAWTKRFIRVRFQRFKEARARADMDQKCSRLGAEVYALHRQGETDWSSSTMVLQQLKLIEESEENLLVVQDSVEQINSQYLVRKQEIAEKYRAKRAGAEVGSEPE